MKKQELLNYFDDELLDKLFGFCYARTNDSYEAQELCSDIIFALVKAAASDGEVASVYPFIWRVARNVYADYSNKRKRHANLFYEGDAEEILPFIAAEENDDNSAELLAGVYRRIAFLTKAYREVMILYYIDGMSTAEIAVQLNTSEGAVRQRLFAARQKIKSEVEDMTETYNKPAALSNIDLVIWGSGNPGWGDPRTVYNRILSSHVVWLCRRKPMSASEIAAELNVPTIYVENELDILTRGENGTYGLLRRLDNGKYAINFVLFDKDTVEKAHALCTEHMPKIGSIISDFIEQHKEEYLAFPYLNKKVDLNLILWSQVFWMAQAFEKNVQRVLEEKYFADVEKADRPFSVFGWEYNGKHYGSGCDGISASNVCGYTKIEVVNIYISRIRHHFHCGHNVANDPQLQLAIRAIEGLAVSTLTDTEKEHAAKAIECGYLYREGDMLYTKILVYAAEDASNRSAITRQLCNGYFEEEAQRTAEKLAELIRKNVPDHLQGEWMFANDIANIPIIDALVEVLIEKGILTPLENGIGAEGCFMSVMK
ncbi:MAG: RNA polymerase sigma factor [Clostridia bacterium]|nr:RNA polymerase sigma factor [Clostridia bacterium]